jgi:outer membrane immunogenic protein
MLWQGMACAPAAAADLPLEGSLYKISNFVPGIGFTWTGFYIGANAGYGWGSADPSIKAAPAVAVAGEEKVPGAVAGGQLGFNLQVNRFVFGIEGDLQWSAQRGTASFSHVAYADFLQWFETGRARVGYTAEHWLFYATGGAAMARLTSTASGAVNVSVARQRAGWTGGGGLEYGFNENWSARAEYLYLDIPETSSSIGKTTSIKSQFTDSLFRVGINYKPGGL